MIDECDLGNEDARLDEIYNMVDDLFLAGNFDEVDNLLPNVDPGNLGITLTIGWLTVTSWAADKLKNRNDLVRRARNFFEKEAPGDVEALLHGLD